MRCVKIRVRAKISTYKILWYGWSESVDAKSHEIRINIHTGKVETTQKTEKLNYLFILSH